MGNICSDCMEQNQKYGDDDNDGSIVSSSTNEFPKVTIPTPSNAAASAKISDSLDKLHQDASGIDLVSLFASSASERRTKTDKDYRGFAFCVHPQYGMLLLHCTRKKKKPAYYQCPGGHVDDFEFKQYQKKKNDDNAVCGWKEQCYMAARAATARELREETGIIVDEDRLLPAVVHQQQNSNDKDSSSGSSSLVNEHKHRLFFVVTMTDDDFHTKPSKDSDEEYWLRHTRAQNPDCPLRLKLSVEHSGFRFEKNPQKVLQLVQLHSGGKVTEALQMALSL